MEEKQTLCVIVDLCSSLIETRFTFAFLSEGIPSHPSTAKGWKGWRKVRPRVCFQLSALMLICTVDTLINQHSRG